MHFEPLVITEKLYHNNHNVLCSCLCPDLFWELSLLISVGLEYSGRPYITTVAVLTLTLSSHQQAWRNISHKGEAGRSCLLLSALLMDTSGFVFTSEVSFLMSKKESNSWQSKSDPYTCFFLWGLGMRFCLIFHKARSS